MKIIIAISSGIAVFIFFYLLGSFVETSFNIVHWQEKSRTVVAIFGGLISFCCGGCIYEQSKLK